MPMRCKFGKIFRSFANIGIIYVKSRFAMFIHLFRDLHQYWYNFTQMPMRCKFGKILGIFAKICPTFVK
jgi:hypothetical protein